jgi:hypothetical protein
MLSFLAFAAAFVVQDQGPIVTTVDPSQGAMPGENSALAPPHKGSDDRMFPDIEIGALRIDGDTLYVQVRNIGKSPSQGSVLVSARASDSGMRSEPVQARTARLQPGETRWVSLRGFSVKTASNTSPVFALASATSIAASAQLLPVSAQLDRSGQARQETADGDENNNSLVVEGSAIGRGAPQ